MYKKKRLAHTKKKEELKHSTAKRRQGQKPQKSSATSRNRRAKAPKFKEDRSGRVTVPLDFFSQDLQSKPPFQDCFSAEQSCSSVNESLRPLLQTACKTNATFVPIPMLRRSKRLSTRSPNLQTHYNSITDYYMKLQSKQGDPLEQRPFNEAAKGGSLFNQINYHYWHTVGQTEFTELGRFNNNDLLPEDNGEDDKFCRNLEKQLASVSLNSRKQKSIGKVHAMIAQINQVLDGKAVDIPSQNTPKPNKPSRQEENNPIPCLIPKYRWSFETPSNQKLKRPAASVSTELKPCILQTNDKSKILMELNANANLNLLQQTLNAGPLQAFMTPFYNNKHFPDTPSKLYNTFVSEDPSFIPFLNNNGPLFNSVTEFPLRGSEVFNSREFNFTKTNEPLPMLFECQNEEYGKENAYDYPNRNMPSGPLYEMKIPCTVTSETAYALPFINRSPPGQNYEPNFVIDEQLFFPTVPELAEPSPLQLFPRKAFDE